MTVGGRTPQEEIAFDENGLVPCVTQDWRTGEVLTLAYMNHEALERTLESGQIHFWSRSRERLWRKGETSGNTQELRSLRYDCDADALLALVEPAGPACHTGERSCFYRSVGEPRIASHEVMPALGRTLADRQRFLPDGSYTTELFQAGIGRIGEKVEEEAEEVARAGRDESTERVREEAADLLYHLGVLLQARGLSFSDALEELLSRMSFEQPSRLTMSTTAVSQLPLIPSLEEARELASDYNVIPVRHTFIDDCETPVSAFLKLRGRGPAFLLESADQGQQFGRYSFLGFRPRAQLRFGDGRLELTEEGERKESGCADPFQAVADYLSGYRIAPLEGLPPFAGGAVGMFGYDLVRTVERLGDPNPDDIGTPDMALMISDALVVFDHLSHQVTIMVNAFVEKQDGIDSAYERAVEQIERARGLLGGPVPRAEPALRPANPLDGLASNMSQAEYETAVARAVDYIHAGDAFQVVPSQRWSGPCPVEAFSVYRGLRVVNPSPYMYFLEFEDFSIVGASPEPMLKVTGRRAEIWPIAGTRPRGATSEQDLQIAGELLNDEKERAEHVMLVDLARNDLGRVCEYASVEVDDLMRVETYSHVLHIVSQVSGTLRPELGALDALRACLPAGTLSGAPKVRAMEIIDELEPAKRGFYGGAIGYLSYSGDLDTCIHIRTAVVKDGTIHVQAGAGIVADSEPTYEYDETLAKAGAVFKAIELANGESEWS